jgi:SsrA-binding protein
MKKLEGGLIAKNKKAYFDYHIEEEYTAGIQLFGSEVKSIRNSDIQIRDSFVEVRDGECFLVNSHIKSSSSGGFFSHEVSRVRKLFLRKSEIKKIHKQVSQKGFTCVPLDVHWSRNIIKINLGVVRGKKNWDKRESIKERELNRSLVTSIDFF